MLFHSKKKRITKQHSEFGSLGTKLSLEVANTDEKGSKLVCLTGRYKYVIVLGSSRQQDPVYQLKFLEVYPAVASRIE